MEVLNITLVNFNFLDITHLILIVFNITLIVSVVLNITLLIAHLKCHTYCSFVAGEIQSFKPMICCCCRQTSSIPATPKLCVKYFKTALPPSQANL